MSVNHLAIRVAPLGHPPWIHPLLNTWCGVWCLLLTCLQTNRDHLKDKEQLRDKLDVEKSGNQGFENTIGQFMARLEEAEKKEEAAQTGAKEAEETVIQLKKQ